jgi:hypothetical protein
MLFKSHGSLNKFQNAASRLGAGPGLFAGTTNIGPHLWMGIDPPVSDTFVKDRSEVLVLSEPSVSALVVRCENQALVIGEAVAPQWWWGCNFRGCRGGRRGAWGRDHAAGITMSL